MNKNSPRFKPRIDETVAILLQELGDRIHEIWLFGSVARGDAKLTSDIDIMVSMKSEVPSRPERFELYDKICDEDENGLGVDLKFCVQGNVNTYSSTFNQEVLRDKVVVYPNY